MFGQGARRGVKHAFRVSQACASSLRIRGVIIANLLTSGFSRALAC